MLSKRVRGLWWTLREVEGLGEKLRVLRALLGGKRASGDRGPDAEPVEFRMKGLDGRGIWVRPGTADLAQAVYNYRGGLHLPPPEVADGDLRQIVELGTNTGSAMAGLAVRYPNATLVGAEPDPTNVAIARRNMEQFGGRCQVVHAALWDSTTELTIDGDKTVGYTVRERLDGDPDDKPRIPATTVDAILAEHMPAGPIDFMTVTIEGTEPRVLGAGGEWASRLRSVRVEFHPEHGYLAEHCIAQLESLGFEARVTSTEYEDWEYVFGVKP